MSNKTLLFVVIFSLGLLAIVGVGFLLANSPPKTEPKDSRLAAVIPPTPGPSPTPPASPSATPTAMTFDKTKKYQVTLKTTAGDIVVELSSQTPITSKNFFDLVNKKFYDGVIFHRVISGFMIQGGDPTGTGTGGPGYKFDDEPFEGEYTRGTVAMANAGPNTNGSQFFIMHKDYPLPKNYVIFGKVASGMEAVDKIATAPVSGDRPTSPVKIISASLLNN